MSEYEDTSSYEESSSTDTDGNQLDLSIDVTSRSLYEDLQTTEEAVELIREKMSDLVAKGNAMEPSIWGGLDESSNMCVVVLEREWLKFDSEEKKALHFVLEQAIREGPLSKYLDTAEPGTPLWGIISDNLRKYPPTPAVIVSRRKNSDGTLNVDEILERFWE